ncbi:MAG: glycosyl-4,4'-diaponeurosporenoate acyltransferase [Clostridiales bacterium]|nr:glycosyl-4,4'-diaponeurosporenoate acyltransferase [Clostridiales bacterium]
MQIIFLLDEQTIILCFIVWPVLQVGIALICIYMPDRYFSTYIFFFRARRFEQGGQPFDRIFKVIRWKHLLPDGGMIWKKRGFRKKKLDSFTDDNLNRFLVESARGELTHWLAILPFWIFGFFAPVRVICYMLLYALFINMPCIIAQRYNRPRVHKLLHRAEARRKLSE